jgi:uncharacterized protein
MEGCLLLFIMNEEKYTQELIHIIRSNSWFMGVLETVRTCDPPDWLIGAGVIRNIVWDYLHGFQEPTSLADVDVIFFDANDLSPERDRDVQEGLTALQADMAWEATNQAAVHLWYEDVFGFPVPPFHSSEEAVSTWPETATSVAVRLLTNDELYVVAPCGLDDLFGMVLRRNPRRVSREMFRQRLQAKGIKQKWPRVKVITD